MQGKELVEKLRFIALVVSIMGCAFKLLHLQGANILLLIGLSFLATCHIILGSIWGKNEGKASVLNYILNYSIAILAIGILFYLMRWYGGKIILYIGIGGVSVSVLLQFLLSNNSAREEK